MFCVFLCLCACMCVCVGEGSGWCECLCVRAGTQIGQRPLSEIDSPRLGSCSYHGKVNKVCLVSGTSVAGHDSIWMYG